MCFSGCGADAESLPGSGVLSWACEALATLYCCLCSTLLSVCKRSSRSRPSRPLVRRERPLRVVVTSATLDGEKFSAYFNSCPVFHVSVKYESLY